MHTAFAAAWAIDRCLKHPDYEEKTREMYSKRVQSRLEIARSLALPNYLSADAEISDLARRTLQFERDNTQDLMSAVVRLTSRSDNFMKITGENELRNLKPGQLIEIDGLEKDE